MQKKKPLSPWKDFVQSTEMYFQRCLWPSVEWYLLIRHLLGPQRDANCSSHFTRLYQD